MTLKPSGKSSSARFARDRFVVVSVLAAVSWAPTAALDRVPEEPGFSGFVLVGAGAFDVESNLIVTGPPLVSDVGNDRIASVFDAPSANTAAAIALMGEVSYTFAESRTQVFLGNRLEDLIRLDAAYGLGVRQEMPDESVLALSLLATPIEMKVWSDPYVEREDRVKTNRDKSGLRLRWSRPFGTELELTATHRAFRHDEEQSGDWLIGQGRLSRSEQPLLDRNGDVWLLQARYRIRAGTRHLVEPELRYQLDDLGGAAMRNDGLGIAVTYLYVRPKLILDVRGLYRQLRADAIHPVYDERLDASRSGVGVTVFYDLFKKPRWRAYASVDSFEEDANIDFFDAKANTVMLGAIWRHRGR